MGRRWLQRIGNRVLAAEEFLDIKLCERSRLIPRDNAILEILHSMMNRKVDEKS